MFARRAPTRRLTGMAWTSAHVKGCVAQTGGPGMAGPTAPPRGEEAGRNGGGKAEGPDGFGYVETRHANINSHIRRLLDGLCYAAMLCYAMPSLTTGQLQVFFLCTPSCSHCAKKVNQSVKELRPKVHPKFAQSAPKVHPKCTQSGPRRRPKCTKSEPERCPKDERRPKVHTKCTKSVQKCTQSVPKRRPKCTQSAPKVHPKCSKSAPEVGPHGARIAHSARKVEPKCTKSAPKVSQQCTRTMPE